MGWEEVGGGSLVLREQKTQRSLCYVGALRDLTSEKRWVKLNPIFSTPKAIGNHFTML